MSPEVLVVGGGPAGAATALRLASAGRDVMMCDQSAEGLVRPGEVLRPEVRPLLEALGVWELFLDARPRAMHGVWSAWGGAEGETEEGLLLLARDYVLNPFGTAWGIDRARFDRLLRDACRSVGIADRCGWRAAGMRPHDSGWTVELQQGSRHLDVMTRFVVDATGRGGRMARAAGALASRRDCLVALVGVRAAPAHAAVEEVLLLEAAPDGWWYSCYDPAGDLVVAYLTDGDLVRAAGRTPAVHWSDALRQSFWTRERTTGSAGRSFHVRPARSACLDRAAGPGWVAVGDAAGSIDPLSGAGITRALSSGLQAADAVHRALQGDIAPLDAYASRSQASFLSAGTTGGSYYATERRWPRSPFWQRRASMRASASSRAQDH